MSTLYFDCFSGAGGDMIVASLIDTGVSIEQLCDTLAGLGVTGFDIEAEKIRKQGFAATKFNVITDPDEEQPHRHLKDVKAIIEGAGLPTRVRDRSLAAFQKLADAEGEAHGISADKVHFHEVGAIDAIVDVVAAMVALETLSPDNIVCSPLPVGSGTVTCQHGVMPVPAPATAILLKGVPLAECDEPGERLTPTAAAVLTTVVDKFGPMPAMTMRKIGIGAGTRDGVNRPNILRAILGDGATDLKSEVAVLETNIDDASPEWLGYCMERLLDEGALDVYYQPIYMKKNRPAVVLTAICDQSLTAELEALIFSETGTFGIRRSVAARTTLNRRLETVETHYGDIRIKVGLAISGTTTAAPEFEDCATAARKHNVPLRMVMDTAMRAWRDS